MRSFYIDESCLREYIIKLENITSPNNMKGAQIISVEHNSDLIKIISNHYGFTNINSTNMQLWSAPLGSINRIRLDTMDIIPSDIDTIYVRGILST